MRSIRRARRYRLSLKTVMNCRWQKLWTPFQAFKWKAEHKWAKACLHTRIQWVSHSKGISVESKRILNTARDISPSWGKKGLSQSFHQGFYWSWEIHELVAKVGCFSACIKFLSEWIDFSVVNYFKYQSTKVFFILISFYLIWI